MSLALKNYLVNKAFPIEAAPLIQCITNEITAESMANALLYVGAKPVMADDPREFAEILAASNALLLNLGHISPTREENILKAATFAESKKIPFVVDLVGVAASSLRLELAEKLLLRQPAVVKGNLSELRRFCHLSSAGRGVDGASQDQSETARQELLEEMQKMAQKNPATLFLATGEKDLLVSHQHLYILDNGVAELDQFTGTGDIVGALIAALIGGGVPAEKACVTAVSYFNRCGEEAKLKTQGLADFREETLNQLSLLGEKKWQETVKGAINYV